MLAGTVSFVSGNTMRGAAVDVCKNTKQTTKEGKQLLPGRRWHAGGIVMRRRQKGPEYHRMSTKYFHLLSCEMQLLPLSRTLVVYQKVQDSGTFRFSAPKKSKNVYSLQQQLWCLAPCYSSCFFSTWGRGQKQGSFKDILDGGDCSSVHFVTSRRARHSELFRVAVRLTLEPLCYIVTSSQHAIMCFIAL